MVRIDVNSYAQVSIRELDERPLGNSMTVMSVESREVAEMLLATCCRLAYDTTGQEMQGYSGYLVEMPLAPSPDDILGLIQRKFHEAHERLIGKEPPC
jgi:hypothetical protein